LEGTVFPGFERVPPDARSGLIIVHGIAEHGGRYRHVANWLAERQIASFVYDQRGHGLSSGVRTHVDDFSLFADDVETVAKSIRARHPSMPLYVWGHSMGSVVVTLAATRGLQWANGVITSGSALDALPRLTGWRGAGLNFANSLLPRLRIPLKIDGTALTQVEEIQREHMKDPLVPRSASLRLLHGFARACETSIAGLAKVTLPWLAIHGEADKVCPVEGSRRLIATLASPDKQLVIYPGLLHEPHNEAETERSRMFQLMSDWMGARLKPG
jgi:alpha-beta hydrolase superfamily lysophospholipase